MSSYSNDGGRVPVTNMVLESGDESSIIFQVRAPGVSADRNESVHVVGSLACLGNWREEKSLRLMTNEKLHPIWTSRPQVLYAGSDTGAGAKLFSGTFEYKYFKQKWVDKDGDEEGKGEAFWEPRGPRSAKAPPPAAKVSHILTDAFGVSGKAKVTIATREFIDKTIELCDEVEEAALCAPREVDATDDAEIEEMELRRQTVMGLVADRRSPTAECSYSRTSYAFAQRFSLKSYSPSKSPALLRGSSARKNGTGGLSSASPAAAVATGSRSLATHYEVEQESANDEESPQRSATLSPASQPEQNSSWRNAVSRFKKWSANFWNELAFSSLSSDSDDSKSDASSQPPTREQAVRNYEERRKFIEKEDVVTTVVGSPADGKDRGDGVLLSSGAGGGRGGGMNTCRGSDVGEGDSGPAERSLGDDARALREVEPTPAREDCEGTGVKVEEKNCDLLPTPLRVGIVDAGRLENSSEEAVAGDEDGATLVEHLEFYDLDDEATVVESHSRFCRR